MKIIVGCPIKDRAWIIPQWHRAITSQEINAEIEIMCVTEPSEDDTDVLLKELGVMNFRHAPITTAQRTRRDIDGHVWSDTAYAHMVVLRNYLKEMALSRYGGGADYFFSLDSDIILPKKALKRLVDYAKIHEGVIAPAVNMVPRGTAWNAMSWVDPERPSMAHRPVQEPAEGRADVIMAAMLIPKEMGHVNWQPHRQGEDVGYSVDAVTKGVKLYWASSIRCQHVMYQY